MSTASYAGKVCPGVQIFLVWIYDAPGYPFRLFVAVWTDWINHFRVCFDPYKSLVAWRASARRRRSRLRECVCIYTLSYYQEASSAWAILCIRSHGKCTSRNLNQPDILCLYPSLTLRASVAASHAVLLIAVLAPFNPFFSSFFM